MIGHYYNLAEIKALGLPGVTSIVVHIGSSHILADVIYKKGKELLNLISDIKKMEGVERIVWSERIYRNAIKKEIVGFALDKLAESVHASD